MRKYYCYGLSPYQLNLYYQLNLPSIKPQSVLLQKLIAYKKISKSSNIKSLYAPHRIAFDIFVPKKGPVIELTLLICQGP